MKIINKFVAFINSITVPSPEIKLEPCPICGHAAVGVHFTTDCRGSGYVVECGDREDHGAWVLPGPGGCHFFSVDEANYVTDLWSPFFMTKGLAADHWNEFVVPTARQMLADFKRLYGGRLDFHNAMHFPFEYEGEKRIIAWHILRAMHGIEKAKEKAGK